MLLTGTGSSDNYAYLVVDDKTNENVRTRVANKNEHKLIMVDKIDLEMKIVETLKTVFDPELPANVYDLGLIYDINIKDNGYVNIKMTLTAPGCPVAGDIIMEVDNKIRAIENVSDVNVMLTFDPPWKKEMMTEEAKLELGFL